RISHRRKVVTPSRSVAGTWRETGGGVGRFDEFRGRDGVVDVQRERRLAAQVRPERFELVRVGRAGAEAFDAHVVAGPHGCPARSPPRAAITTRGSAPKERWIPGAARPWTRPRRRPPRWSPVPDPRRARSRTRWRRAGWPRRP